MEIVIPDGVPEGFGLFYTTSEFHGRLDDATVAELMSVVRERFGIEANLTTCNQIHSANVRRATSGEAWRECDSCDALWSTERHVALGIKVADCLPVTIIDPENHVIANVHSGWRGAVQDIVGRTLESIPIDASRTIAFLGPSIRVCCFEVGEEVAEKFDGRYVSREHDKPHVDIPAYTVDILKRHGIEHIIDTGLCTRCPGSRFHSFRREPKRGGRNLAIVAQ
jgi:YfiH family protein